MMLPVHEMFHTFQGEGVHMGRAAFFVRLYGCPVHCPWCDAAGTWHPDHIPDKISRLDEREILREVEKSGAPILVLTGGEPTIHDLTKLYEYSLVPIHLETTGGFKYRGPGGKNLLRNWITLSPKWAALPLAENLFSANEVKLIIEKPEDIHAWLTKLREIVCFDMYPTRKTTTWLHPEWTHRNDPVVLNAITEAVKENPRLRAGWQLHKLYQADLRDNRSRKPVPLGGNPELGY